MRPGVVALNIEGRAASNSGRNPSADTAIYYKSQGKAGRPSGHSIARTNVNVMRTGVAYLLAYLAVPNPDDEWADIGNDPDFRQPRFTWGICRTNVRGWAQSGDDLFFHIEAVGAVHR